jgi:hypothetical protein
MKTWFAVAVVLSGLALSWLLVSMDSCSHVYEIDAQGRLVEPAPAPQGPAATKAERPGLPWESKLPQFADVAPYARPGDQVEVITTTTGYPVFALSMTTLGVTHEGRTVLTVRDGALRFWGTIAGLSAFPVFSWGVAAFWIAVAPGRRRPP